MITAPTAEKIQVGVATVDIPMIPYPVIINVPIR